MLWARWKPCLSFLLTECGSLPACCFLCLEICAVSAKHVWLQGPNAKICYWHILKPKRDKKPCSFPDNTTTLYSKKKEILSSALWRTTKLGWLPLFYIGAKKIESMATHAPTEVQWEHVNIINGKLLVESSKCFIAEFWDVARSC